MEKRKSRSILAIIFLITLMFIWMVLAVALTGGREIADFTDTDWVYFGAMIVLEILTFGAALILAAKLGKIQNPYAAPPEKKSNFRAMLTVSSAMAIATVFFGLGCAVEKFGRVGAPYLYAACVTVVALAVFANFLLAKRQRQTYQQMSVADLQKFLLSHREEAEKAAAQKQELLLRLQRNTDLWALALGVLGALSALSAGAWGGASLIALALVSVLILLPAVARIRLPRSKAIFDQNGYVSAQDYPTLYALAEKARDTLGCAGEIHIQLTPDCNAGIALVGKAYSVMLGTTLLKLLSEQELYACLLHEFGHAVNKTPQQKKLESYVAWLSGDATHYFLSRLCETLFLYPTARYTFEHGLYLYAISIIEETNADRAAVEYANAEAFASLLLKLKYNELYEWEQPTHEHTSDFSDETPKHDFAHRDISLLYEAFAAREADWKALVDKEILARNASHPTVSMRLAAMHITDYHLLPFPTEDAYACECEKALCQLETEIIEKAIEPQYDFLREERYLEPLADITAWEEAGKPLKPETYADLFSDLYTLGRMSEAEALTDRAIAEFSDYSTRFACFNKGQFLLRRYDPTGVELLYAAMENSNYIEDALQLIGMFACIVGDQEMLDGYRERAMEMVQKERDEYSHLSELLPSDRLSAERLPPELLQGIIDCVNAMENAPVQEVYVLHKQISDTFSTTPVILRFRKDVGNAAKQTALNAMFQYLDTADWQFSLFDYEHVKAVKCERFDGSRVFPQ